MADPDYDFWRARLSGAMPSLPMGTVASGYWRIRRMRNGPFLPLATWRAKQEPHVMCYKIGNEPTEAVTEQWAETVFPFATKNPVKENVYRYARQNGSWPDDVNNGSELPDEPMPTTALPGSNFPPDDTAQEDADPEFDAIVTELEREKAQVTAWLEETKIETQEQADRATNWIARIEAIDKRRNELFEARKKPVRELANSIDQKFRPVKDLALLLKQRLKDCQADFLIAKRKAAEAAAAKAREEAFARGNKVNTAQPRVNSGTTGRKVSLVERRTAKIIDFDACYAALKDHPEMRATVQALADRAAHAQVPLAGIEVIREMVTR